MCGCSLRGRGGAKEWGTKPGKRQEGPSALHEWPGTASDGVSSPKAGRSRRGPRGYRDSKKGYQGRKCNKSCAGDGIVVTPIKKRTLG